MINLLPEETKREIQAARANVVLFRYNLFVLSGIGLLAAMCLLFYVILQSTQSNAMSTTNDNSVLAEDYADVKAAADNYNQNLAIASQILDNGVSYTSYIFELTKLLPSGVVLEGLNLTAADFGKQVTFNARASSYAKAAQLKDNFQNSKIFTNVHFENLSDSSSGQSGASGNGDDDYPIVVTISVMMNKVEQ